MTGGNNMSIGTGYHQRERFVYLSDSGDQETTSGEIVTETPQGESGLACSIS